MFKTLISRYVNLMTHMFNSEGSGFINKYNTTIEVTVYLSAINDLPLSRTKEVKGGHPCQNSLCKTLIGVLW